MSLETPPKGCYWVDPGKVMAGPFPFSLIDELLGKGIRAFINLHGEPYDDRAKKAASARNEKILCCCFPLTDFAVPPAEKMKEILSLLLRMVDHGVPVYIHCMAGQGRTGMLAGCYLIATGQATPENFVDIIRALRTGAGLSGPSPDNFKQVQFAQQFAKDWLLEDFSFHKKDEET